jgi:transaldolase
MSSNPLKDIQTYGQSIWLDDIRRGMITGGDLQRLVAEDGLRGVTSNPAIFDKAISGSADYDGLIAALAGQGRSVEAIYRALTVQDVQMAADVFRPLYDTSGGDHGFVSLEVNPHLAYRTQDTIGEARELWRALDRPNVFIKVPATPEGLPAIQQLISEGINVNVTLLFGLPRYGKVAEAYIAGLEQRATQGQTVDGIRSVASFFLSRIDVLVDSRLEALMDAGGPAARTAEDLHGQVAIASAKQAYQIYKEIFHSPRFRKLADRGARSQRLLWASTSTKNPDYPDVKYVEALIGPETVNTLPGETLDAYRDHGEPAARLEEGVAESRTRLENLAQVGIDIDQVTEQLEQEGVDKFNRPFDNLMQTLADERARFLAQQPGVQPERS